MSSAGPSSVPPASARSPSHCRDSASTHASADPNSSYARPSTKKSFSESPSPPPLPTNSPEYVRSPLSLNTAQIINEAPKSSSNSPETSPTISPVGSPTHQPPSSPRSAVLVADQPESRFRSSLGVPRKLDSTGTCSAPVSPVAASVRRFKPVSRGPQCEIHPMSVTDLTASLRNEASTGPDDVLLIDVRPYTMYSFTRLRGAISICIPSTLLKRSTFGFRKIMDFVAPQDVDTLNGAASRSRIIFYDQATSVCAADSTLRRTAAKFVDSDATLAPKLHFLVGGLGAVAKEAPELIEAGEDLLAALPESLNADDVDMPASESASASASTGDQSTEETPRLTLSSVKAAPRSPFSLMPVVTAVGAGLGSPINSPSRNRPPLDESSSIHVDGEIANRLPEFPQWLVNAVKLTECGQNVLAESFQHLQAAEMQRVTPAGLQREPKSARLLSPRFRVFTPRSTPTTPHSDTSGLSSQSASSTNTSPMFAVDNRMAYPRKAAANSPLNMPSPQVTSAEGHFALVAGDDPRKNRYTNIAPFGYNRVMVRGSEYINASYIRSRLSPLQYIATQAPVPASFGDFWWCVYEQKVPLIVMLTTLRTESGQVKGNKYWFNSEYDGLRVELLEEHEENRNRRPSNCMFSPATNASISASANNSGLIVRTLRLTSPGGVPHTVIQVQYENWPDLGCPADPNEVLDLVEFKKSILQDVDESSNIIVHCSAGCGRTGTFCTIDTVTDYLSRREWQELQEETKDLVLEVVGEFREQRIAMVQNQRQLLLCYQAVMLWYLGRLESGPL